MVSWDEKSLEISRDTVSGQYPVVHRGACYYRDNRMMLLIVISGTYVGIRSLDFHGCMGDHKGILSRYAWLVDCHNKIDPVHYAYSQLLYLHVSSI